MENRKKEFEEIKSKIKVFIEKAKCGLFNSRNVVGDVMTNIYKGKYFELDICYRYAYFEIFGATDEEYKELNKYYGELGGMNEETFKKTMEELIWKEN